MRNTFVGFYIFSTCIIPFGGFARSAAIGRSYCLLEICHEIIYFGGRKKRRRDTFSPVSCLFLFVSDIQIRSESGIDIFGLISGRLSARNKFTAEFFDRELHRVVIRY